MFQSAIKTLRQGSQYKTYGPIHKLHVLPVICPSAGCSPKTSNTGAQNKSARLCVIWETFKSELCFLCPSVSSRVTEIYNSYPAFCSWVGSTYCAVCSIEVCLRAKVACLFSPRMLQIHPVQDISTLFNSSRYSWLDNGNDQVSRSTNLYQSKSEILCPFKVKKQLMIQQSVGTVKV